MICHPDLEIYVHHCQSIYTSLKRNRTSWCVLDAIFVVVDMLFEVLGWFLMWLLQVTYLCTEFCAKLFDCKTKSFF